MVHVFCAPSAAPIIKAYSAEMIVHPTLVPSASLAAVCDNWLERMHAVVIGPGLGRNPALAGFISELIAAVRHLQLPLIVDAVCNPLPPLIYRVSRNDAIGLICKFTI